MENSSNDTLGTLGNFYDTKSKFETIYKTIVKQTKNKIEYIYGGIYVRITHNTPSTHVEDSLVQYFFYYFFFFQAIAKSPLLVIDENISPLYNHLKFIWIMSKFYSEKRNMERLLESISDLIAERISTDLTIPDIFRSLYHFIINCIYIVSIGACANEILELHTLFILQE